MRMRNDVLAGLTGLALAAVALAGGGAIESTFDADTEGWGTLNDATNFTWTGALGNPAGAIRATDQTGAGWWFFSAPEAYLGDKSSFVGAELSWDIYGINGNQATTNRADIMLIGTDVEIGINLPVEPESGEWTSWSVIIDSTADWRLVTSQFNGTLSTTPATQADIEAVLADLQAMHIRGEYTVGNDASAIDNVRLTPPPCGDVTDDGNVDLADLNLVLAMFGMDTPDGDANGDGTVDLADLNLVLSQFGGNC